MKYSLPTGEVVDIDIEDILEIDFKTIKGKQVFQEIMHHKDHVKKYLDFDDAIENDSLKFIDKEEQEKTIDSLEEFEAEIYLDILKEKSE